MALGTCLWNVAKRDENFIEPKKTGGWLRYFNVSRRISSSFLLLLWKSDGVFEKRKAMGVVHFACIIMFNVKHPLFNVRLHLFTRIFIRIHFLKLFFLCVCSNWPMKTWTYIAVGSCPLWDWIGFLCSTFHSGLSNCFLKTLNRDIWLQLTECQIEELSLLWFFFSSCMWCLLWLELCQFNVHWHANKCAGLYLCILFPFYQTNTTVKEHIMYQFKVQV